MKLYIPSILMGIGVSLLSRNLREAIGLGCICLSFEIFIQYFGG